MLNDSGASRRTRILFLGIILTTIPCYCIAILAISLAPERGPRLAGTATPTLQLLPTATASETLPFAPTAGPTQTPRTSTLTVTSTFTSTVTPTVTITEPPFIIPSVTYTLTLEPPTVTATMRPSETPTATSTPRDEPTATETAATTPASEGEVRP